MNNKYLADKFCECLYNRLIEIGFTINSYEAYGGESYCYSVGARSMNPCAELDDATTMDLSYQLADKIKANSRGKSSINVIRWKGGDSDRYYCSIGEHGNVSVSQLINKRERETDWFIRFEYEGDPV